MIVFKKKRQKRAQMRWKGGHTYRQSSKRGGTPWRRWPKTWCLSPGFLQRGEGESRKYIKIKPITWKIIDGCGENMEEEQRWQWGRKQIVDNDRQDGENKSIAEDVIIHLEAAWATSLDSSSASFAQPLLHYCNLLSSALSAVGPSRRPFVCRWSLLPNSSAEKCCVQKDWPLVSFISYSSCRPSPWESRRKTPQFVKKHESVARLDKSGGQVFKGIREIMGSA